MRRIYDKEEIKEIAAESGGSKVDSLDLVVGQPTVTYDTTDGITIESTEKLNGTDDIVVSNEIPIVAGKGIVIDKLANKEQVAIKANVDEAVKFGTYSLRIGNTNTVGSRAVSIGQFAETYDNCVSLGCNAATTVDSIAVGYHSGAKFNSVVVGTELNTIKPYSIVLGMRNAALVDGDKFVLADGVGGSGELAYHNYFKITKDSSNVYHMFLDNTEVPTQTKTLFGNQSIVGSGNIDLFCHNISFQDKVFFTAYSSNNLEVNSLTDLQTLFPADVWKSASGSSPDDTKVVCAINCSQMKVRYTDNSESSLAEYEAPVDTVNTI